MATVVLVHGAWHGAWCWFKLIPRLEAAGHRVIAPDLPGLGRDRGDGASADIDAYAAAVVAAMDGVDGPVLLAGHSMGGAVISAVAERVPERIGLLVYLCAFLVEDGQSVFKAAGGDSQTLLAGNMIPSADRRTATVRDTVLRDALYADCSDEDVALARLLLVPQSSAAFAQPVRLSAERYGTVPRVYVECTQDRAIGIDVQRRMWTASPCREVVTLEAGHSPFLSQPDTLSAVFDRLAGTVG